MPPRQQLTKIRSGSGLLLHRRKSRSRRDLSPSFAPALITGTSAAALTLGSYTTVPAGSAVTGRITAAKAAVRLNGSAEGSLELMSVRVAGSTGPEDASLLTQTLTGKTTRGREAAAVVSTSETICLPTSNRST